MLAVTFHFLVVKQICILSAVSQLLLFFHHSFCISYFLPELWFLVKKNHYVLRHKLFGLASEDCIDWVLNAIRFSGTWSATSKANTLDAVKSDVLTWA